MHPLFHTFHVGERELTLHTYGVLVALGFALGIVLAWREGKRVGLEGGKILDLAFWILVGGLAGSRLLYVAINLSDFVGACRGDGSVRTAGQALAACTRALQLWEGGLVFYGGALAAAGVVALFVRRAGWSFWTVGDVFAPS